MLISSGFSPMVKKTQPLQFQGRHEANNADLHHVKPGDKVTFLHSQMDQFAKYDESRELNIVNEMVLDHCDTHEVVKREGHQGRKLHGYGVPSFADSDRVDYLELKGEHGEVRPLLYGAYGFKNEHDEQVIVDLNAKDEHGKPIAIAFTNDGPLMEEDNVASRSEIKPGIEAFKKFNPFAKYPKERPLPAGMEHMYS